MKKTFKRTSLWFLLLITTLALTGCYKVTKQKAPVDEEQQEKEEIKGESNPERIKGKKLTLSITYGYDRIVKYGRTLRVNTEVTNNGEDFTGYVRIILPKANEENVMLQKETTIPAGETKNVVIDVPYNTSINKLKVMVLNEKEKKVIDQNIKVNVVRGRVVNFWGVLSDNTNQLSYLGNNDNKVFYLTKKTFSRDYAGLNTLDIILINDYNTNQLSDEQYDALKEFVSRGGTLVLGTGVTGDKVLGKFTDDFVTGTVEKLEKKKIVIGNDTLEEDILPMKVEGSHTVLSVGDVALVRKKNVVFGNVQIVSFDLGLEDKYWKGAGATIVQTVIENLSETKQSEINENSYANELEYQLEESMGTILTNKLPNVSPYALILLIYVLVVGPILYLVLKQKDKRSLTWVLVPGIALIFTFGIYLFGSTTRITKPYMSYISFLNLGENNKGTEQLFFNVTAPYNKPYSYSIDRDFNVEMLGDRNSYYGGYNNQNDKIDMEKYKIGFQYSGDKIDVKLKNFSAFESVYFKTQKDITYSGSTESKMEFFGDKFSGTFTNKLGYDLENVLLVSGNNGMILGNIKNGEKVDISKKKVNIMDGGFDVSKVVGGDPYGMNATKNGLVTKYYTLDYFIQNRGANSNTGDYIIGFTSNDMESQTAKKIGLRSQGISAVVIPIEMNCTKGNITYIPSLDSYGTIIEGEYDEQRYMQTPMVKVEYAFHKSDNIQEINYSKLGNPELNNQVGSGFVGEIKLYNYSTGTFDTVFTSKKPGKLTELKDYISKDNTMLVQYIADETTIKNSGVFVPVLSGVKKAENQ